LLPIDVFGVWYYIGVMDISNQQDEVVVGNLIPRDCGAAKFTIGTQVKHRIFGFRGVIFDVDPSFSNSEEWYLSIPEEVRPRKDQPFYHLFAESPDKAPYEAYVSEQNLVLDVDSDDPISHPEMDDYFEDMVDGRFVSRTKLN
jgi:heat shock protein HspQ